MERLCSRYLSANTPAIKIAPMKTVSRRLIRGILPKNCVDLSFIGAASQPVIEVHQAVRDHHLSSRQLVFQETIKRSLAGSLVFYERNVRMAATMPGPRAGPSPPTVRYCHPRALKRFNAGIDLHGSGY